MGELNFGGTELRTVDLLPRLAAAGVVVDLVTLSDRIGPGPLASVARRLGGTVHALPLDLRFPARFLRLLRRLRPDAVHTDFGNFSGVLLTLAALAGVPTRVAHFRGDDNEQRSLRRRVQRVLFRRMLDLFATDVLGVSPSALTCGYSPTWTNDARCRVVLNGLDLDRLLRPSNVDLRATVGAGPGALLCLTVGRASAEKRRWFVPPVIAALRDMGIEAHAVLVGPADAADDARVRQEAVSRGVNRQVHLLGPRADVGGLLRQADIVLAPSILEGLPGSVLEPVAIGTPVVSVDLPGVRFIADHLAGVTLVDRDASAEQWAANIRTVVTATRADDRGEAVTRFRASAFSLDAAVAEHVTMYRRRLGAGGPGPEVEAPDGRMAKSEP
ncbi:glycosyltransferase [Micromonospora sp. SL1-18]|uniref:glycosyltransferase n=1 Tax=Micromonospora sp. SL1-18 TaxID=3399128 RepID=UPI003A4D8ECF